MTQHADSFHAGQTFTFTGAGPRARCTVRRIEEVGGETVAHVSLDHVDGLPGGTVGHLPISVAALADSGLTPTDDPPDNDETWREGYDHWREANGGVFATPLADCVSFIRESIAGRTGH